MSADTTCIILQTQNEVGGYNYRVEVIGSIEDVDFIEKNLPYLQKVFQTSPVYKTLEEAFLAAEELCDIYPVEYGIRKVSLQVKW